MVSGTKVCLTGGGLVGGGRPRAAGGADKAGMGSGGQWIERRCVGRGLEEGAEGQVGGVGIEGGVSVSGCGTRVESVAVRAAGRDDSCPEDPLTLTRVA
jgi:hypothetical protein